MLTIGSQFEHKAEKLLQAQGLKPVCRNFRSRFGEIDLIMRDGDSLVFVEVRYRQHQAYGSASESVNERKQHKLILAAQAFLASHPEHANKNCRFDVVGFDGDKHKPRQTWVKNAFESF